MSPLEPRRELGASLLVAGTCIGSGTLALPLTLASLGLIPSIALMVITWSMVYFTSLVSLELNLQAERGLPLGTLARIFSGRKAEWLGVASLTLLSYSLLAVYINGLSSVVQQLFINQELLLITTLFALITIFLLTLRIGNLVYFNRLLFICLLFIVALLTIALTLSIDPWNLPLWSRGTVSVSLQRALPILFASFGFQVIFHTLTNYCSKDARMLKRAFFFGSLLSLVVYALWTGVVLGAIYQNHPDFYHAMVTGKADVGQIVDKLSTIANSHFIQNMVWSISLLAIMTSVLGVGVGLCDEIKEMLIPYCSKKTVTYCAPLLTVLPSYFVAAFVSNAFIVIFAFAGMTLVVVAIFLPVYLLVRGMSEGRFTTFHYPVVQRKVPLFFSLFFGMAIVFFELIKLFS